MAFIGMYQTMTKKAAITVQVGAHVGPREVAGDWLPRPLLPSAGPILPGHKTESRPTGPADLGSKQNPSCLWGRERAECPL